MNNAKKNFLILTLVFITGINFAQTGWIKTQLNLNSVNGYNLYATDAEIYASTRKGIYSTTNNGASWLSKGPIDNDNWVCDVIKSHQYILAANRFGIYRSSDNGSNWLPTNFSSTFSQGGQIFAKNSTYIFFIKWAQGIFRSSDDGQNWEQIYVGQDAVGYPDYASTASCINVVGENIIIGISGGAPYNVYLSSDNGNTWTSSFFKNDQLLCLYNDNGKLYAGGLNGVYMSSDLGNTWTTQCHTSVGVHGEVIGYERFRDIISYNQNLIAAVDTKSVLISSDNGINWTNFSNGMLSDLSFTDFVIKPPYIFGITGMPGEVYCRLLTEITTKVENNTNSLPSRYSLSQNYPNPFNPTTKIKYEIQSAGKVRINIFDILGREIAVLVNEEKNPGIYEVSLEASHLSSGSYFYKIESGNYTETKKLTFMK